MFAINFCCFFLDLRTDVTEEGDSEIYKAMLSIQSQQ